MTTKAILPKTKINMNFQEECCMDHHYRWFFAC